MLILGLRQVVAHPTNNPNAYFYSNPLTYLQNILLLGLNEKNLWGQCFRFNAPAWTLDIELQYYILVPFLCAGWITRKRFVTVTIASFSIISAVLLSRLTEVDMNATFITWSLMFLFGFLYYKLPAVQKMLRNTATLYYGGIFLITLLCFLTSNSTRIFLVTFLLVFIAARLLVLQKEKYFGKMDSFWGDLSYPVYIFHYIVIDVSRAAYSKYTAQHAGTAIVNLTLLSFNLVASTLMGYLMLRIIANPVEKVRDRLKGVMIPARAT
jgi:peptidoglycan/LPS O-acetylase OafA/YrhL